MIKKVKNTVPWTYVIRALNGEEIAGTCYERELKKINEKEFRFETTITRKGDKLYAKWKDYDHSFNSWIDQKDIFQMSEYFPKQKSLQENVKIDVRSKILKIKYLILLT